MGCCSSTFTDGEKFNNTADNNFNNTLNGYYGGTERQCLKRSFSSHISNGSSSGVSTACTSPSRRSIFSRSDMNSPSPAAAQPRTCNDIPIKDIEMLSICDNFCDGANKQQNNKSYGYHSESMSTGASTSQGRVRTQDTSAFSKESPEPQIILPPSPRDLEMEMYMMYNSPCLMPKMSSPICQRRDVTYDAVAAASPPSRTFQKWSNYLQMTPAYVLNSLPRIPEAIAGQFSPLHFPAYTDLEDMERAAKRFKIDHMTMHDNQEDEVFHRHQIPLPSSNIIRTASTDL